MLHGAGASSERAAWVIFTITILSTCFYTIDHVRALAIKAAPGKTFKVIIAYILSLFDSKVADTSYNALLMAAAETTSLAIPVLLTEFLGIL